MGFIRQSDNRAAFERLARRTVVLETKGGPPPVRVSLAPSRPQAHAQPAPQPRVSSWVFRPDGLLGEGGGAVLIGLGADFGVGVVPLATAPLGDSAQVVAFPIQDQAAALFQGPARARRANPEEDAVLAEWLDDEGLAFLDATGSMPLELAVWELLTDAATDHATAEGPDPSADALHLGPGQTATVAYWKSDAGRSLVLEFNGGASATRLGNWLATTLPHLYGPGGVHDLTGKTNLYVAGRFRALARESPPSADAQVFATALAVYATCAGLGGPDAAKRGFRISANGVGASCCDVGPSGAAFGVFNGSAVTVLRLLEAYDQTQGGLRNGATPFLPEAARLFSQINEAGSLTG